MIHSALLFLYKELNSYLELRNGATGDLLKLTNVATEEGKWAIPNNNLGLSLINIEEERAYKDQKWSHVTPEGVAEKFNPDIKVNLYILVTANYTSQNSDPEHNQYFEGLKQLSYVMSFFQQKNVFTPDNSPLMVSIDPGLRKLSVELYSYSFEQLNNFWTVIGAKYLPSVLYKVRLISFQEMAVRESGKPIQTVTISKFNK